MGPGECVRLPHSEGGGLPWSIMSPNARLLSNLHATLTPRASLLVLPDLEVDGDMMKAWSDGRVRVRVRVRVSKCFDMIACVERCV